MGTDFRPARGGATGSIVAMTTILGWSAVVTTAFACGIVAYGAYARTYEVRAEVAPDRVKATSGDATLAAGFGARPDAEHFDVMLREAGDDLLELTIVNRSNDRVTFIDPQVGSHRGWVQPTYEIEAYGADGRRLEMLPAKAGTVSASIDPKTAHVVPPGRRFVTKISTSMFGATIAKVRVHYRFDSARVPLSAGDKALLRTRPVREVRVAPGAEMQERLATMFNGELKSDLLELSAPSR